MTLAVCKVNSQVLATSGITGLDVLPGSTITISLTPPGGSWSINCTATDGYNPASTIPLVQATKSQNLFTNTCTFVVPTMMGYFGASLQFTSIINNDVTSTFTFGVFIPNADGTRQFFAGENQESNITYGIAYDLNSRHSISTTGSLFSAGGDLSGSAVNQTVIGIQTYPVDPSAPSEGYLLQYLVSDSGSKWYPVPATNVFTASGDLSGNSAGQEVIGIFNHALPGLPGSNQYLHYTGSAWAFSALPSSFPPSGTAGGDLSGTYPNPTVVGLQTNPVSNIAPACGDVLYWNCTDSGSEWTPIPSGNIFTAGGDLAGSGTDQEVIGILTKALPALSTGYLNYNGTAWQFSALPSSLPPSGSAGGDLTGTYPNPTIAKLQGNTVSASSPTSGQVLEWNGSAWAPASLSAGVTWTTDLLGSNSSIQYVYGLSGDTPGTPTASEVHIHAANLLFDPTLPGSALTYNIPAATNTPVSGGTLTVYAGVGTSALSGNNNGGAGGGTTIQGGVGGNGLGTGVGGLGGALILLGGLGGAVGGVHNTGGNITLGTYNSSGVAITSMTISPTSVAINGFTSAGVVHNDSSGNLTSSKVNLTSATDVTGVLPAANQAAQTVGGDLVGTTTSATVYGLSGDTPLSPTASEVHIHAANMLFDASLPGAAFTFNIPTATNTPVSGGTLTVYAGVGTSAASGNNNGGAGGGTTVQGGVGGNSTGTGTGGLGGNLILSGGLGGVSSGGAHNTSGNILLQTYNSSGVEVTAVTVSPTGVALNGFSSAGIVHNDASGNLTSSKVNLTSATDVTGTLPTANQVAQSLTLTGDITSSGGTTASASTTLATVNSNTGTFGDGTHVGQFTVNAKGLITAASAVAITGAAPTGTAGGDLAGSYPNPTVSTLTGSSNIVEVLANSIQFLSTLTGGLSISQTQLGNTTVGNGANAQDIYLIGQDGQNTTHAGATGGNGGNIHITSGLGGTGSTGGSVGSVILATGGSLISGSGTPQITVTSTNVTLASLAGSGAGYVAVNNSGVLSFVSGIAPSGSAGGDLSGSYPNPTVAKLQGSVVLSGTPSSGQVLTATSSTAASWATPATGLAVTSTTVTNTTGTVTLTSTQYGKLIIQLSATLSGNLNITFPNQAGLWFVDTNLLVLNGFTITFQSGTATFAASYGKVYTLISYGSNTLVASGG